MKRGFVGIVPGLMFLFGACYKAENKALPNVPARFDVFLKEDLSLTTQTGNIRDSACRMYVVNNAVTESIRFEFDFTSGNPTGQNITFSLSNIPAGVSIVPSSIKFGLNYTWYPSVSAQGAAPGTYPVRVTITSPAYGTEQRTIYVVVD